MAASGTVRYKKPTTMPSTTLLTVALISFAALLLFIHSLPSPSCGGAAAGAAAAAAAARWSGDLRDAEFSWNSLPFRQDNPPPTTLKIAVFTRKWPVSTAPGGMERHALTLHSALARRGHEIHVFTSLPPDTTTDPTSTSTSPSPRLHFLPTTQWKCDEALTLFAAENDRAPFDAVHSESVALYHRFAAAVPNLAVTWHGISLEALHSSIHQDLLRRPSDPIPPALNRTLSTALFRVLDEIRFFPRYAHHVAISDATGATLRDDYQLPSPRVHVILNGVDEAQFRPDPPIGAAFRAELGVPADALLLGVAGRLVKDKGHPILHQAFAKLAQKHGGVYLVVAGAGPWGKRYQEMGERVMVVGSMGAERLRGFYNAIDAFVNPTLRPQGLDLTMVEAMRCGTAVVATRFPSVKGSVVVEPELGFMFAPNAAALGEALEAAVGEGRRRLAERGRACAAYSSEMFAAGRMAMAYERLFLCIKDDKYCTYPLSFDR